MGTYFRYGPSAESHPIPELLDVVIRRNYFESFNFNYMLKHIPGFVNPVNQI